MNYDLLIQRLNKLEEWLESTKGKYTYYPLRWGGYVLLIAIMIVSNLLAVIRWPFAQLLDTNNHDSTSVTNDTVHNVNEDQLQDLIKTQELVLVDFWADWCGPCIMMNKPIQRIAESEDISCIVAKVNTVRYPDLAEKYDVKGLPTLLLFENGSLSKRFAGALSYSEIKNFIEYP
mgnify:CR=1 FL=1